MGIKKEVTSGWWKALWKPSTHYSLGSLAIFFSLTGVILWGGFNWSLELTNTESFCISCHEMKDNVYQEYKDTIHYSNRTGIRATCPDCHVPKVWIYKVARKIRATNELFHKISGTINTTEKFNAKRFELAKNVWQEMKANNSRECRNCHTMKSMDLDEQEGRSRRKHETAMQEDKTCIDCHKGIAHELPDEYEEE